MSRSLPALPLTALLALTPGLAMAQDSDPAPETETEAAPAEGAATPETGTEGAEPPGLDTCSLVQVLVDGTDNPVAEVSLFRLQGAQAAAGATVIVPLETFLPGQLTIAVDGGAAKRYNYQFCNQIGCIAQIGLTQADVDAFRAGNAATVTIIPAQAPDQPISLNMSLTGFTAGYNVVDVVSNQ